jgi:pilus assembly protein CpaF
MSLLRRMSLSRHDVAFHALLERLQQDEASRALLLETLTAALPNLDETERSQLTENPLAFLFPPPKPRPPAPPKPLHPHPFVDLKLRVSRKILEELDPAMDVTRKDAIQEAIRQIFDLALAEEDVVLNKSERERLFETIMYDIMGFGPLELLLRDDTITDIWILGAKNVFVTRKGHRERSLIEFEDENHILRILDRIIAPIGKRCFEGEPMVTARMPDGSQLEAIIRPLAQQGPSIYIRKFSRALLKIEDLLRFGTLPDSAFYFLQYGVLASLNLLVVGAASAGKTTLLNVLANAIPADEFVSTIENVTELHLTHPQLLALQTRPPTGRGADGTSAQQVITQALHFQPDYVVLSDTQGAGLLSVLESGRSFMLDVTAPNSEAALRHLRHALRTAQPDMSDDLARDWLAAKLHLVAEINVMRDYSRKVTRISEPNPDGSLTPIFEFEYTQNDASHVGGRLRPTGFRPRCLDALTDAGLTLPTFIPGMVKPDE